MRRFGWAVLALFAVAAATAAGVLLISGDEGSEPPKPSPERPPSSAAQRPAPSPHHRAGRRGAGPSSTRQEVRAAVADSRPARLDSEQRQVAEVVRAYVGALDARDGARACRLFAPGALSGVELPRRRGGCGRSLSASIGYRDPRGFPVFAGSRIARIRSVSIAGANARVTATTVTRFAGGREPSVEDDLVYLRKLGRRWVIVKPSATLYRAIGVGNIPPQVLAPP